MRFLERQKLTRVWQVVLMAIFVVGSALIAAPRTVRAASDCSTYGMTDDGSGGCLVDSCFDLFDWAQSPDAASMARSYRVTQPLLCPGDMMTTPIGTQSMPFTGTFDGDNNIIEHVNIDGSGGDDTGLFGDASGATFTDVYLSSVYIEGHGYSGALVGSAINGTTIHHAHVESFYMTTNGNAGGIVGKLENSTIAYSLVNNSGIGNDPYSTFGGIAAYVDSNDSIAVSNSYVTDTAVIGGTIVGGLFGELHNAVAENVYARATVTETGGGKSGGLTAIMGGSTIRNAYFQGTIDHAGDYDGGIAAIIVDFDSAIENTFTAFTSNDGVAVGGIFGTQAAPLALHNNWYESADVSHGCYAYDDGGEVNCSPTTGTHDEADYWLNGSHEPMASWDTMSIWNLNPGGGQHFPTLLGEGELTPAAFDSGDGSSETPYLISNCRQLQHMQDDLDANYALVDTVDCSETRNWFGGRGFSPVGDDATPFQGSFEGGNNMITDLTIIRANDTYSQQDDDQNYVGLFGKVQNSTISHTRLIDAKIKGYWYVGGIAGYATDSSLDGNQVNVDTETNDCGDGGHCIWARWGRYGGGIVGLASGGSEVFDSVTGGPVKGSGQTIGGIVGELADSSTLDGAASSSHIDGGTEVGGIVGHLVDSYISDAHATGDVVAQTDDYKNGTRGGGLVGFAESGTIQSSSAMGAVYGSNSLGGFVGETEDVAIDDSTASGDVTGSYDLGGFVGSANASAFTDSHATSETISGNWHSSGGFVGAAACTSFANASAAADVIGWDSTGGFAGSDACGDDNQGAYYERASASGDVSGEEGVGGLVGSSQRSVIYQSSATGTVSGSYYAGGLVGTAVGDGRDEEDVPMLITQSYATGDVSGTSGGSGGLVGILDGGIISNSYARGDVQDDDTAAGLIGSGNATSTVQYSYTTGLVSSGIIYPTGITGSFVPGLLVTASYWDATVNPDINGNGFGVDYGAGLSTEDLQDQSVLAAANFDFIQLWGMNADFNDGYACLQWTESCIGATPIGDVNGDGIGDQLQPNVVDFIDGFTDKRVGLELSDESESCEVTDTAVRQESQFAAQDVGFSYPNNFIHFAATCVDPTITVKLYFYETSGDFTGRKYNPDTATYASIPGATTEMTTIYGDPVLVLSYQMDDNGPLDLDPADGAYMDPVGLGSTVVSAPNTGLR